MRDVSGKTFVLQVFDKDTLSKDYPLGEVKEGKISDYYFSQANCQVHIPLAYFDQTKRKSAWVYLTKYSGKIASPAKSTQKQSKARSR